MTKAQMKKLCLDGFNAYEIGDYGDGHISDEVWDLLFIAPLTEDLALVMVREEIGIASKSGDVVDLFGRLNPFREGVYSFYFNEVIEEWIKHCKENNVELKSIKFLKLWNKFMEIDDLYREAFSRGADDDDPAVIAHEEMCDDVDGMSWLIDTVFDSLVAGVRESCSKCLSLDTLNKLREEYNKKTKTEDDFPYAWLAELILMKFSKGLTPKEVKSFLSQRYKALSKTGYIY